ncbi:hypothetical protein ACWC5F_13415 [Streptomyces sp. NPDC001272]|uniref:hypothetical protein n=1 Tax=unclassified Streptomyces TaxID=2593676 RepID=UPI00332FAA92
MAGWHGGWARGIGRTTVALAAPPLAAALAFGVARESAYGRVSAWWVSLLGGLLLPLLLLGGHAALAVRRKAGVIALSAIPAGLGALLALASVGHSVLEDRGVEISCVVLKVTQHTETDSSMDADGHWTTTSRTAYDHLLRCPPGGPAHLDTSSRLAKEGEALPVLYDPRGRVSARAAVEVHGWGLRTAAVVTVGVAALLGLAGGVVEAYQKRGRRPRGARRG